MDSLLRELRHGARMLRKTPGASFIAVLALTIGIGLTTMMFSILYGAMIRGLPFDQPEELIAITRTRPAEGSRNLGVTIHDFVDWRASQRSFDDLFAYYSTGINLAGGDVPVRLDGAALTAAAFRVLGVRALMGRTFTEDDDRPGAPSVLLIGWDLWQRQFGGDPGIIGRGVRANGEEVVIVGVMPRGFGFPNAHSAWVPLRPDPGRDPRGQGQIVNVLSRLRDGTSLTSARVELDAIAQRLAREYPASNEGVAILATSYMSERLGPEERALLWSMLGAVIFVLLIACGNVANLLIGRAVLRTKEIGVRTALGASRLRVISQFLAESFVLALAGAVLGTGLAAFGIRAFNAAIVDTEPPYWLNIALDGPSLLCAIAAGFIATLAAGAIPAIQAARANTHDILKDESRGTSSFRLGRLSRVLVAGEIAMSVGLLVGAGLMIKSVVKLYTIDLGFDATQVFTARTSLADTVYVAAERRLRFAEQLLEQLEAIPGVEAATIATQRPGINAGQSSFAIQGETYLSPNDQPAAAAVTVAAGFFAALGFEPLAGREFTTQDRDGAVPVAVVNLAFERRYFAGQSAIGRRLRIGRSDNEETPWLSIVGVVPDLQSANEREDEPEAIYRPLAQASPRFFTLLARSRVAPATLAPAVRAAIANIDPDLALDEIGSLQQVIRRDNWPVAVLGTLFVAFGAAALFLASIGLYGVMAFSVTRRRREMGVRIAVGAQRSAVLGLVLRQGMTQTAIGLAIGTLFALAVSRVLAAILFRVEPRDPLIFATTVLVLVGTAALACWLPAQRAARFDPVEALRSE
ncbi:MAG: ABC transporter permease [Gemmatimonadetes bacterium]|nr:ABC transporter permease [Gemmatimonadota bacterium]